jgi:hypothetical protein
MLVGLVIRVGGAFTPPSASVGGAIVGLVAAGGTTLAYEELPFSDDWVYSA